MPMNRREFLKAAAGAGAVAAAAPQLLRAAAGRKRRPNFVYILADDLGYAELGCYGQKKIKTPHLDRMAVEGMKFTQHYAGAPVCAPSRCCLMTGLHTGHAYVRGNLGRPYVGQLPIPDETVTLAELLKKEGYATACTGKWGLGGPGSTGLPNKQGFGHWFGYLDQWMAHSHYPKFLWRNDRRVILEGNASGKQGQYSHDLFTAEALKFIRDHKDDQPFFLYVAYAVPHVSLHVPADSLAEYRGKWPETPFKGGHYAAHPTPRAAYAAMVSRMDRDVGRILALLKKLQLEEDTLVIFTSDNGPTYAGGADSKFFESAGPLRGLKGSLYEGGIRVPMIARWPGTVRAGSTTPHVSAFWDVLPTFLDLAAADRTLKDIDGVSFAPTLRATGRQKTHRYLYWESHGGAQAVRMGDWKAVRRNNRRGVGPIQLFDLKADLGEGSDVAARHPKIVQQIKAIMTEGRSESPYFNFGRPAKARAEWFQKARVRSAEMARQWADK